MKIELECTDRIVRINNSINARVWQGKTSSGIPVAVLVPRIAIADGKNGENEGVIRKFEKEMADTYEPTKETIKTFHTVVEIPQ